MLWSERDIEEIKRRSYNIYQWRMRNGVMGDDKQDYFDAEELMLDEILAKEARDNRVDKGKVGI